MISLLAIFASAALLAQDAPSVSPEVAREWRVRALAMGEEPWPTEVDGLGWEERCLLLDAARRSEGA